MHQHAPRSGARRAALALQELQLHVKVALRRHLLVEGNLVLLFHLRPNVLGEAVVEGGGGEVVVGGGIGGGGGVLI